MNATDHGCPILFSADSITMKRLFTAVLAAGCLFGTASADVTLDAIGQTKTIDFEGFAGNGFAPADAGVDGQGIISGANDGRLDSYDWSAKLFEDSFLTLEVPFEGGMPAGNEDFFSRGDGYGAGITDDGIYNFITGGSNTNDASLGVVPRFSDTFDSGFFALRLLNNTGNDLSSILVDFTVFDFNNQSGQTLLNLEFSADGSTFSSTGVQFESDLTADASWKETQLSTLISTPTPIADQQQFFLRWNGSIAGQTSGLGDIVAIDNISVTAVPEPSSLIALGAVSAFAARRYRRRKNG
ncbi:PEP-CTERM sorting domain-containing protein [Crateriforma conspicua]|uniref:PEP-CTERM sorting domain-containing protein n=1 Tax=Crateriforma conspicua TaxID=2527996 RepID=UPI0013FD0C5F|nr:PEP-CTERM sorting domain-containing protein [Crateriforma conspicua]